MKFELKLYYFDENGEPQRANNNIHAEYLRTNGVTLYTKGEAQAVYLAREQKKIDESAETPAPQPKKYKKNK